MNENQIYRIEIHYVNKFNELVRIRNRGRFSRPARMYEYIEKAIYRIRENRGRPIYWCIYENPKGQTGKIIESHKFDS